jgi:hypothetical protein
MPGWLIPRIGMMSSLIIGTVAGSASHLALAFVAAHGGDGGNAFWTFALAVGVCLRLRVDSADHLHVHDLVGGACDQPVRPADFSLRFSGQHSSRVLGLRDRAYRLRLVLIWISLIGIPVGLLANLCLVPRRDIGRGADPGRRRTLN